MMTDAVVDDLERVELDYNCGLVMLKTLTFRKCLLAKKLIQ
jgi:hypothetical protein